MKSEAGQIPHLQPARIWENTPLPEIFDHQSRSWKNHPLLQFSVPPMEEPFFMIHLGIDYGVEDRRRPRGGPVRCTSSVFILFGKEILVQRVLLIEMNGGSMASGSPPVVDGPSMLDQRRIERPSFAAVGLRVCCLNPPMPVPCKKCL